MRSDLQVARPDDERGRSSAEDWRSITFWPCRGSMKAGEILGIVTVDDAIEFCCQEIGRQRLPKFFG